MKNLSGILLVLFLTACQNSLIADLVTRSGQILYHDDFSDPSSGWPRTTNANGTLDYSNSAYRMLVQSTGYDLVAVSGQVFGDVQIEVDATRLAGPVINRYGLICRFEDIDNFYVFFISSDGYYAIGKVKDGVISLIGQEMMAFSSFIQQDSGSKALRFDCAGNALKGYVNGQIIAIASDADLSEGDAGLIAGAFDETGVDISFEHFVVYKP